MNTRAGVAALLLVASVALSTTSAAAATANVSTVQISADEVGGPGVVVPTIVIREDKPQDIGTGSVILAAPEGFEFVAGNATVRVAPRKSGLLVDSSDCSTGGADRALVTGQTNLVGFTVCRAGTRPGALHIEGLLMRPEAGTPLAEGSVIYSSASTGTVSGLEPGTPLVHVVEVPGEAQAIAIDPLHATTRAGVPVRFNATGADAYGNPVTQYTWRIESFGGPIEEDPSTRCEGSVCGSNLAGGYMVSASSGSRQAMAPLYVEIGPAVAIYVSIDGNVGAAGERSRVVASGQDEFGNSGPVPLDELSMTAAPDGGGSTTSTACDAAGGWCTATDAGTYYATGRVGDLTDDSEVVAVTSAAPSVIETDLPATARASVMTEYIPFSVDLFDVYGNTVEQLYRVELAFVAAGSGFPSLNTGPSFYPSAGHTPTGRFNSSYDAGPIPGRDRVRISVHAVGSSTALAQREVVIDVS